MLILNQKFKWLALLSGAFLLAGAAFAQDSGPLIDLLVKKGLINDQEGEELRADLARDSSAAVVSTISGGKSTNSIALSGRLQPGGPYTDRWAVTEALLPIVQTELTGLLNAGCTEITVDEPSMSCYAFREDPIRFVDLFNRTVAPAVGRCRLSTHLCFGNYKGRAVGPRQYAPMFPAFLHFDVDEIHLEMASREFSELELIETVAKRKDVSVGIVDVKSYYIETVGDIAARVRRCMQYAPPERLSFAPDCGLSQTARWAAKQKLANMVLGVKKVRQEMGLP